MSSRTCQTTHAWCAGLTWDNLADQLFWAPVLTQLVLAVVIPIFGIKALRNPLIPLAKAVERIPGVFEACFLLQGILSLVVVGIWINRTYKHKVDEYDRIIELCLCGYFIFHYMLLGARKGFIPSYPWEVPSMIDAITIANVFAAPDYKKAPWIGLGYLRVQRCLIAWTNLERSGILPEAMGELVRAIIGMILRTMALTICLGGTVMVLEIVGDPQFIEKKEKFITTDMGDLSFVQMTYWIFTTMSTVGYGDFSPTTVLSRFFVIFAIVVGILFFTAECDNMMSLQRDMGAGKGKYFAPFRGIKNVVVLGGGVATPSSILSSFLDELYAAEHEFRIVGWPACSLMSVVECPEGIKTMISNLPEQGQSRVKYFMGNPMDNKDLERLKVDEAELVFIIPNIGAVNKVEEDEGNILRALAVKRTYPKVNLRLACLTPESLRKAMSVGIKTERTFSLNELKSSILSQSCLCRGWTTFLTNLLTSSAIEDAETKDAVEEPWMAQYRHGYNQSVYGFCLDASVAKDGIPFAELCAKAREFSAMPIGLVGADGEMYLSPLGRVCKKGDVIFALATSNNDLSPLRDDGVRWQDELRMLRKNRKRADTLAPVDMDVADNSKAQRMTVSKRQSKGFHMPWQRGGDDTQIQEIVTLNGMADRLDPEIVKQCEANAEEIGKAGAHYVLVLLASSGLWQQVQSFIKSLRRPQLLFAMEKYIPIVILCSSGPPSAMASELFAKDPSISFIIGNPTRSKDLQRLNVTSARAVVLLTGQQQGGDPRMSDSAGVITLTSMENMLLEARSFGVPILAEILNEESLHLLEPKPKWLMKLEDEDVAAKREPYYKHPRFASGGIFVMNALGGMIAQAYYTRGIVELMISLVVGNGQEYIPWQITLPAKFVGTNWNYLVFEFLQPPWNALCLGLYRPCTAGKVLDSWFMYTNPPPSTVLNKEDLVTVLGNKEFGKKCDEERLIATKSHKLAELARAEWAGSNPAIDTEPDADVVGATDQDAGIEDQTASSPTKKKAAPKKKLDKKGTTEKMK